DALLGEQLAFEVEPGRKPHVRVGRPCEAIEAAVLAAAIRVDRAVEGNVGRIVAGDDAPRLLPDDSCDQRLGLANGPETWVAAPRPPRRSGKAGRWAMAAGPWRGSGESAPRCMVMTMS